MIKDLIREVRAGDHPELGEEEYVKYILNHVVFEPHPSLQHAFILRDGQMVGYTGEMMCEINIHLILASVLAERMGVIVENPLLWLDCEAGAIKIKGRKSFMWDGTLTQQQVKKWIEVLERAGMMVVELGDRPYSLSQIKQMDLIMLKCHLRNV